MRIGDSRRHAHEPVLSYALYVVVAAMWLVPDRRIEKLAMG